MQAPLLLLAAALLSTHVASAVSFTDDQMASLTNSRLGLNKLNAILNTEMKTEMSAEMYSPATAGLMWKRATWLEWSRALKQTEDGSYQMPFAFCHTGGGSGRKRLNDMHQALHAINANDNTYMESEDPIRVLYNNEDMTCAMARVPVITAAIAAMLEKSWFIVQPAMSLTKLTGGSVDRLSKLLDKEDGTDVETNGKTEMPPPRIQISLCEGVLTQDDIDYINNDIAYGMGQYIRDMILEKTGEGFSLVSELLMGGLHNSTADYDTIGQKKSRREFWKEVFENGIDAEGGVCDSLIESMNIMFNEESLVLTLELPLDFDKDDAGSISAVRQNAQKVRKWCGLSVLAGLTLLDWACWVDVEPEMKVGNIQSSWLMQSGVENNFQFYDVGLDGAGQVVAVSDTGVDVDNCYFWDSRGDFPLDGTVDMRRRKVVQYIDYIDKSDYDYGHGTHVAGTIVGHKAEDGITESDGMANGVAKGAKLAFIDIGRPDGALLTPIPTFRLLNTGKKAGARLHSASWGSSGNGYGYNARAMDDYIHKNNEFLIMVAAGNSGRGNAFDTVGDPATAKNIISVGAAHSTGSDLARGLLGESYIADFSSKGNTADGRTKPDVVAPGKYILSAGAQTNTVGECDPTSYPRVGGKSNGVLSLQGTSMATPGVSGVAAIIRQYFMEGWYPGGVKNMTTPYSPTGAAVKAVILNGGQAMRGVDNGGRSVYPSQPYDSIQNFGRVSLIDSVYLPGKTRMDMSLWDRQYVRNGEAIPFNVTIDESKGCRSDTMSVTLVWSDPPANIGCLRCLLNDLDLYVEKIGDQQGHFPNGLSGPDSTNNAERVRLPANDGDQFTIYVRGRNLVSSRQQFALVATGCFGGVANTIFPQDENSIFSREMMMTIVVGIVGVFIAIGVYCFLRRRRNRRYRH